MHLAEINIYPIKSLKGISLKEAKVEPRGLKYDRRWMLTDLNGHFFTQREFPKMATIEVSITDDGLNLTAPNAGELNVGFEPPERSEEIVHIWNDSTQAIAYGKDVNGWFSDVLETPCRLVYMADDFWREVDPAFAVADNIVSFADAYPFLVIGEGSLNDLNDKLEEPLPMNRFRPNLVVAGSEAFEEHEWRKFAVGENVFFGVKPCKRCVMTTIDQNEGVFTGKEPLKTLATYRGVPGGVIFGENLLSENPGGTIKVGDEVKVIERK